MKDRGRSHDHDPSPCPAELYSDAHDFCFPNPPQEQLWAGEFGNDYIIRNRDVALVDSNRALFDKILSRTQGVTSAIEFGANIGNNLRALRDLLPTCELHSVEINATAAAEIQAWGGATVEVASLMDFEPSRQ